MRVVAFWLSWNFVFLRANGLTLIGAKCDCVSFRVVDAVVVVVDAAAICLFTLSVCLFTCFFFYKRMHFY